LGGEENQGSGWRTSETGLGTPLHGGGTRGEARKKPSLTISCSRKPQDKRGEPAVRSKLVGDSSSKGRKGGKLRGGLWKKLQSSRGHPSKREGIALRTSRGETFKRETVLGPEFLCGSGGDTEKKKAGSPESLMGRKRG